MKRKYIIGGAVLLLLLGIFSYFHVTGRELTPIAALTEDYRCEITVRQDSLSGLQTEYTLTGGQILRLRELILSSSFTRIPSNSFRYSGLRDTYSFLLELEDSHGQQQDFIQLYCVEGLYFRINAPYYRMNLTLKINSPGWHEQLQEILESN